MSTAEQWAGLLGQEAGEAFSLKFERLGLEARCRPLRAGEVEECVRMGGERGLRYALYLACDELREAGEHLKKQGALVSAFDITEQLSYGDVVAAGAAILGQSGTGTGGVHLEGGRQASFQQQGEAEDGALLPRSADRVYPGRAENWVASAGTEEDPLRERPFQERDAGDLADRLWAAWGNR